MELPFLLREKMTLLTADADVRLLKAAVAETTRKYKTESGHGKHLVTTQNEVSGYIVTRMPATFCAVASALSMTDRAKPLCKPHLRILDVGAGTGAGTWAAYDRFGEVCSLSFVAVERESAMLSAGRELQKDTPLAGFTEWVQADILDETVRRAEKGEVYDLVLASYVTNELTAPIREKLNHALLRLAGEDGVVLFCEPGTPAGFSVLRETARQMKAHGAFVIAPCPQTDACPLGDDDWCHFTCRVPRSKLHKYVKGGEVPYEDEKFSCLAVSKASGAPCAMRVLRHPVIEAGRITLTVCSENGWERKTVTKRDKAMFAFARKASAGDGIFKPQNAD